MALDPSISLGYRPPQVNIDVPSPIHQMGQLLTLRQMMEAGQQRQLEMQQTQQAIQQNAAKFAQAQRDQGIYQQANIDANGDPEKTANLMRQRGASTDAVFGFEKHAADIRKTVAEATDKELGTHKYTADQVVGGVNELKNAPADQYPALYTAARPRLMALDNTLQLPETPVPQAQLGNLVIGHQTFQQVLDAEKAKRDAAKTEAETEKAKAETAKTTQETIPLRRAAAVQKLENAYRQGQDAYNTALQGLDAADRPAFPAYADIKDVSQISKGLLTPEQRQTAAQFAITSGEAKRHNLSEESTSRLNAAVNAGRLQQEKIINGIKYGPGTTQFWTQQLFDNPDSVKELPPEMKSAVGQAFTQKYGLPLPTALGDTAKSTETSARTALDSVAFIRQALQNPEIRQRIGPIMGRLGEAEQDVGATVGMSPEATQAAQELRTRMRYFLFQEGKAILGGRMPQKLMDELQSASARSTMNEPMIEGALRAAEGSAQNVIQNLDRQRFGGKARSAAGAPAAPAAAAPKTANPNPGGYTVGHMYGGKTYLGGDPNNRASWR